jgi:hypothetical protein
MVSERGFPWMAMGFQFLIRSRSASLRGMGKRLINPRATNRRVTSDEKARLRISHNWSCSSGHRPITSSTNRGNLSLGIIDLLSVRPLLAWTAADLWFRPYLHITLT